MITIAITAFKEEKTIGKAIESVLKQKIPEKYELIVSCPDEPTASVVREYAKKHKQIKLFKDPGKGKPAALNLIFKKARGRILILTDGDVFIGRNAISLLLNNFTSEDIGAVTGRPVPQEKRKGLFGYWSHLLLDMAHEERFKRNKKNQFILLSGYLFAMRNIIKKIPTDVLDDAFISKKLWLQGYKLIYEPNANVYIKNPSNFGDWLKQKRRNTAGYVRINYYLKGKEEMRSFMKESLGIFRVLFYAKTPIEFFYSFLLIPSRLLAWILGFWDTKIVKKEFKKYWVRIETTK